MLKNKRIKIAWKEPDEDDWFYFWVIETDPCGLICLQGVDDPETGEKHAGDTFWVPVNIIDYLEEVE